MLLKVRSESEELLVMRCLNTLMELSEKEKFHYSNLEKGYEGEVKFDLMIEGLLEERHIINDLLFEVNNSYSQIDTVMISQGVIQLFDVKNYKGDFYLKSDKLYSVTTNREYKNPVTQLARSATLFRQLLQNLKQNYLVEAYVIFINPEFTLFQAPMDQPIILPTQLNRFMSELNKTPSKLNEGHNVLAQKLLSIHQTKNPYTTKPEYNYDQLQKGFYCIICKSFMVTFKKSVLLCKKCGHHENIKLAILRKIKEYRLLFPERKITTQSIYEWSNAELNRKTFCRVLKKNYTSCGKTKETYYI